MAAALGGMETKSVIFSRRLTIAVLWNILLQILLAVLLVHLIQVDLLHPLSWITSTVRDIFAWKMGFNIILLGLVSFLQAFIYGSYYMTPLPKYFTRFAMFWNLFSIQNLAFSILYALSGYFTMGLYSSLAQSNFNLLRKLCQDYDGQCLNEQSLFLQFAGMWMGLYYFMNVHIFSSNILVFPPIYQDKFQQIKHAVSSVVSTGFHKSMMPAAYYCLFYYMWGGRARSVVSSAYSLYLEDPPLDNIFYLLSSGIWIGLWFYTSLFLVSVYTMRMIFNIILTEPMKFPIESAKDLTLHAALAQKLQFNGYLGAQDLKTLAMTDPERRKLLFTLSQPGGHPRNWNNVLEKSLNIINDFCKKLDDIYHKEKKQLDESPEKSDVSPPIHFYQPGTSLRNMAESPYLYKFKDQNKNDIENTFTVVMRNEFNLFLERLCEKPGISYFFGELTDTRLKFLLLQGQPVMWTCEGIALIAAASLKEDKYGVIQSDLPIVISALVKLKQHLEKLSKPGLVPRKHILNDEVAIKMKNALMSAVKRSIYKIVLTFSRYIREIPLDPDVHTAIQPFLLCREA